MQNTEELSKIGHDRSQKRRVARAGKIIFRNGGGGG
jgi:hypothetical protein